MPGALHARSYRQPAVEPDPENAAVLKKNLAERLPNVRSAVCQKTVQSWRDPDQPVDAVVLFHFLYYLNPEARLALHKTIRQRSPIWWFCVYSYSSALHFR